MNAQSSLENLKEIIRAIRNTPGLYDCKHDDFLVHERREQCWENVANSVNLRVDELKSRWRVLRDRYVRYQRKLLLGRIDRSQVRFPFFEQMKFLDPFIKRRGPKQILGGSSNMECKTPIKSDFDYIGENISNSMYNDESQDENTMLSLENVVNYNHDNEEYIVDEIEKDEPKINDDFHSQETIFVDSVSPIDESMNQKRLKLKRQQDDNNLDEDDLFGKSLGMSLKKLSRLNNVRAKAEIYQVLQKYIECEEIRTD